MTVSEHTDSKPGKFQRLQDLFHEQLQQGSSPRDLALAFALGATLGIMPLVWGTSVICVIMASCLRVNQVAIQVANYLMYPLQIILFFPYLVVGERIFATNLLPENYHQLLSQLKQTPFLFFTQFWQSNLQALLIWLLLSPLCFILMYRSGYLLTKRIRLSSNRHQQSP